MKKFLSKLSRSFRGGEKGFTLIEILIVIVILGIMAAVAIPQVTKFIKQSKIAAANSELGMVNTTMGVGMADAGVIALPGTGGDALDVTLTSTTDFNIDATHKISDFIQGTNSKLSGTYTFDASGRVTTGSYPGTNGWDNTERNFH